MIMVPLLYFWVVVGTCNIMVASPVPCRQDLPYWKGGSNVFHCSPVVVVHMEHGQKRVRFQGSICKKRSEQMGISCPLELRCKSPTVLQTVVGSVVAGLVQIKHCIQLEPPQLSASYDDVR